MNTLLSRGIHNSAYEYVNEQDRVRAIDLKTEREQRELTRDARVHYREQLSTWEAFRRLDSGAQEAAITRAMQIGVAAVARELIEARASAQAEAHAAEMRDPGPVTVDKLTWTKTTAAIAELSDDETAQRILDEVRNQPCATCHHARRVHQIGGVLGNCRGCRCFNFQAVAHAEVRRERNHDRV